jgi:nicotinate-nucleotide pyrophosphorylase (carboxylating)
MSAILFDAATAEAASVLARMSLQEDLRDVGDLTSLATIPAQMEAEVRIVSRQQGVACGLALLPLVFHELPGVVTWTMNFHDGQPIERGTILASIRGPVRTLLTGERTVLNFLTHLSGIATRTAEFVAQVQGTQAVILDTRKTLPGYRLLQKYAVRCGGGTNHRMGLYDGILIKDNHLAARGESGCATAVADARQFMASRGASATIEIEVDSLAQLRDALKAGPDIVLLDNMTPTMLSEAVQIRNSMNPSTRLEASGGVTLETVREIAKTGVERISVGSLTHSSPSLDLGFDWPW